MRNPRYEVYRDRAQEWRWRLRAANGQIVSASDEAFGSHAEAQRAVWDAGAASREALSEGAIEEVPEDPDE